VAVVRTGTANLASVLAGLERAGAAPRLTGDAAEVREAAALVLPGVGAFGAAMAEIERAGLTEPLRARLRARLPTLAICLGLQLLCRTSDESPGVEGLGIVEVPARRFPDSARVPQIGWNLVEPEPGCALLERGHAYFANSFRLEQAPSGWLAARSEYAGPFVAAIERGPVLACQFHPELSGRWGLALIERWLRLASAGAGAPC
jgi:imidazole glycerol phosphate synthase glutamine amidotransferase subunit